MPENTGGAPQPGMTPQQKQQASIPQATTSQDPSAAFMPRNGQGRRDPMEANRNYADPQKDVRVNPRTGVREHRHQGYGGANWKSEWHPVDRKHGRRGASSEEAEAQTEDLHEDVGLGKDGMGGDSVSRTMMGETDGEGSDIPEEAQQEDPGLMDRAKQSNVVNGAALVGTMIGKNIALNAGNLTDSAFSGIRNAVNACMSGDPLSAAGSIITDSLSRVGDTTRQMEAVQRQYGIGNPDGQSLESTIAGRLMTRDQKVIQDGAQRGLASVSRMMQETGADDVANMDMPQLQAFTDANSKRIEQILRQFDEDDQKPKGDRMTSAERKALTEELRVHADMNKEITTRAKGIRSDAKEMAARIGHDRQYRNQVAALQRKEAKAKAAEEAQKRYDALPEWGKAIHDTIGARVSLDNEEIPYDRAKRTAAGRMLESRIQDIDRRIRSQDGIRAPTEDVEALRAQREGLQQGLDRIREREAREQAEKDEMRRKAREAAQKEREAQKLREKEQRKQELIDARSDFTDPAYDPAHRVQEKYGVFSTDRSTDGFMIPTGTDNNPRMRNELLTQNADWESYAAHRVKEARDAINADPRYAGLPESERVRAAVTMGDPRVKDLEAIDEMRSDPRYIRSKNMAYGLVAENHKSHVLKQMERMLTQDDDTIKEYFEGADRSQLEDAINRINEAYAQNRTAAPYDEALSPGRDLVLANPDKEQGFHNLLNSVEDQWGLTRYARRPKAKARDQEGTGTVEEPEPETVETRDDDGDDGTGDREGVRDETRAVEEPEGTYVPPEPTEVPSDLQVDDYDPDSLPSSSSLLDPGDSYDLGYSTGEQGRARGFTPYTMPPSPDAEAVPYESGEPLQMDLPPVPGEAPAEAPSGPVETPQDEGAPKTSPEEPVPSTWDEAPGMKDRKGRSWTPDRVLNDLAQGGGGEYLVSPQNIMDAINKGKADKVAKYVEGFKSKYDMKNRGPAALSGAISNQLGVISRSLERDGVDTSDMDYEDILKEYYNRSPEGSDARKVAIRTMNQINYLDAYNTILAPEEDRTSYYDYRKPAYGRGSGEENLEASRDEAWRKEQLNRLMQDIHVDPAKYGDVPALKLTEMLLQDKDLNEGQLRDIQEYLDRMGEGDPYKTKQERTDERKAKDEQRRQNREKGEEEPVDDTQEIFENLGFNQEKAKGDWRGKKGKKGKERDTSKDADVIKMMDGYLSDTAAPLVQSKGFPLYGSWDELQEGLRGTPYEWYGDSIGRALTMYRAGDVSSDQLGIFLEQLRTKLEDTWEN